jgi:hypothetical protein
MLGGHDDDDQLHLGGQGSGVMLRLAAFLLALFASAPAFAQFGPAVYVPAPVSAGGILRGDTFVGTAGTGLQSHTATGPNGGWSWNNNDGTGGVAAINASNQLKIIGSSVGNFVAATVGSNDQYAQIQVMAASDSFPITVRSSGSSAGSFYGARYNVANNHWEVFKNVLGSFTSLGSVAATLTPGDTAKLQVIGSSLTLFVNGASTITATDSSIATGVPGLEVRSSDASAIDPWVQNFQANAAP